MNKYLTKISGKISERDRIDYSSAAGIYSGVGGALVGYKTGEKTRRVFHEKVTVPNSIKEQAFTKAAPLEGQSFKQYMKRIKTINSPKLLVKDVSKAGKIGAITGGLAGATLGSVGVYKALSNKTKVNK